MEPANHPESIELSSVLRRDQYVRLHRLMLRSGSRTPPLLAIGVLVIAGLSLLLVDSPVFGLGRPLPSVVLLAAAGAVSVLLWRQPYRLWASQERMLATPGSVTLDSTEVRRVVPGVVEGRIPWSSIEATLDAGDVLALRITKFSWVMLPMPEDPVAAARVRSMVASHVPGAQPAPAPPGA